jgi:hypothetical protein
MISVADFTKARNRLQFHGPNNLPIALSAKAERAILQLRVVAVIARSETTKQSLDLSMN